MDRRYKNKFLTISSFLIAGVCSLSFGPLNNSNDSNANFVDITFSTPFGIFKDTGLKTSTKKLNKELTWKDAKAIFDSQCKGLEGSPKYSDCSIIDPQSGLYTNPKWYCLDSKTGKSIELTDSYQFNYNTIVAASFEISPLEVTFKISDDDKDKAYIGTADTYSKTLTVDKPNETTYGDVKVPFIPTIKNNVEYIFSHYVNENGDKVGNDYMFTKPETLTAVIINNPGVPKDFASDDWSVLLAAANKGYTSLSTKTHAQGGYKEEFEASEYPTGTTKPQKSFVGLEKTLKVGGIDYKVRVVDENADFTNVDGEKAVLTFEFVNLIHPGKSFTSNQANSNVWKNSDINYYLNNNFFNLFPSELKSDDFGIRTVKKYTNNGNGAAKSEVSTVNSKLFIPSLKELNIDTYPDGTTVANEGVGNNHDTAYKYYGLYKNILSSSPKKKYLNASSVESDYLPYWTRSADIDTPYYAYDINSVGSINSKSCDILYGRSIPCFFCIGADLSGRTVTFDVKTNSGNWGDTTSDNIECKVAKGGTFAEAKAMIASTKTPTRDGCVFDGWYTQASGGTKITNEETFVINESFTAYAHFTSTANKIKVTFDEESAKKYNFDGLTMVDKNVKYECTVTPKVYSSIPEVSGLTNATIHTIPTIEQVSIYKDSSSTHEQLSSSITINGDGKVTIPASAMTENITIEVVYSNLALDWENITKICNADEAAQSDGGTGAGDIVNKYFDLGDSKELNYNGTKYNVRIIDMAHSTDKYTDSNNKTKIAALTFDFVDCIGTSKFINNNNYKNYKKSYIDSTLETIVCGNYTDFKSGDTEYPKKHIKNVAKECLDNRTGTLSKTTKNYYFFIPSAYEYCVNFESYTDVPSWLKDSKYNEGQRYSLYVKFFINSKYKTKFGTKGAKKYGNSSNVEYWTRSYADHFEKGRFSDSYSFFNLSMRYMNESIDKKYKGNEGMGFVFYNETNQITVRNNSKCYSPAFCL